MSTAYIVMAVLGFFAFIQTFSLSSRIGKLERQLRQGGSEEARRERADLSIQLRQQIGKNVKIDFYDDEEDMDVLHFFTRTGFVKIVDVDEKWLLVHMDNGKKVMDKLLRIDSVKSIGAVD